MNSYKSCLMMSLMLCLLVVWACSTLAEMHLQYRKRGNRFEGIRPKPVSGYDIEPISARVDYKEEGTQMPERFKVKVYLAQPSQVHLTVRELDYKYYYSHVDWLFQGKGRKGLDNRGRRGNSPAMARESVSSPVHRRLRENRLMCRIIRVPATLDKFFGTLSPCFHWDHLASFRWLVLVIALAWGRRHVAKLYRDLEATPHRTRCNNFLLVARWDPAAALRQKAPARRRALHLGTGETIDVVMDDAKQATRGKAMEAVAKMKDPMTAGDIRGQQDVCALLVVRAPVIPWGIRL
jgi:hypothetical protein